MRWRINTHKADGITVGYSHLDADTYEEAVALGTERLSSREKEMGYRVTADAMIVRRPGEPCPRCGSLWGCGGPNDPHE